MDNIVTCVIDNIFLYYSRYNTRFIMINSSLNSGEKGSWEPSPEMITELYKKLKERKLHIEWVSFIIYIYTYLYIIYFCTWI